MEKLAFSNESFFVFMKAELRRRYRNTRRESATVELECGRSVTWLGCRDLDPCIKEKLMTNPDQFFKTRLLLKDGNTCTVVEVVEGKKSYVLKRYNQKTLWYRCLHMCSSSRALKNWSNGMVLHSYGVVTPQPLACLLFKSSVGLLQKAYVLMEYVDGPSLSGVGRSRLMAVSPSDIPRQFAKLWGQLDELNATHGDMKASNFILDQQGVLNLIDLDSFQFHRSASELKRSQTKDMNRFMKNWNKDPEVMAAFKTALQADA